MTSADNHSAQDFEHLLRTQIAQLTTCRAADINKLFEQLAQQALNWFNLDRMSLFPNSVLWLNDIKTRSFKRPGVPTFTKERFVKGNFLEYLKLLDAKTEYQTFNAQQLRDSAVTPLQELYEEGGRWHGIVRLELFGQSWGTMTCARFNDDEPALSPTEIKRLKMLCDIWLVYWQHSTVIKGLSQGKEVSRDERELLGKLSKKQCAVLALLAKGLTAKQCAEKLFLSPRTIESHKYRMLNLLDLTSHNELIQFALRNGIDIEPLPSDDSV